METTSTPSEPPAGGLLIGLATVLLMALHDWIAGAAIFGICRGIAGFYPGGALPALGTRRVEVAVFVAAVIAGVLDARLLLNLLLKPSGSGPSATQPELLGRANR